MCFSLSFIRAFVVKKVFILSNLRYLIPFNFRLLF